MFTIVVYDTPSNKRRRRMFDLLKDFLVHVQKSVFEGNLEGPVFLQLLSLLSSIVKPDLDSLRIYQIPKKSRLKSRIFGWPPLTDDRAMIVVSEISVMRPKKESSDGRND